MDALIPPTPSPRDARPKCVVELWDQQFAVAIKQFARLRKWPVYDSPRWNSEAAAILRRRLEKTGAGRDRMVEVWRWYEYHYSLMPAALPKIACAKRLDAAWDWVVREMEKAKSTEPPDRLTKDAQWVLRELSGMHWPGKSEKQLPAVVSQSLANVGSLVARLNAADLPRSLAGYRSEVLGLIGNGPDYVAQWFRAINRRYATWADWSGDLGSSVWTPLHAEFVKQVGVCLRRYTGTDDGWPRLAAYLT